MSRKATSSWSRPSILGCTSTEESESENTMWLARLGKRKRTSDFWILLHYFAKTWETREIKSCDLQRILILRQAMSWGHVKSLFVLLVGTDQFLAKLFDWAYPNVWWSSMSFIIHCKYQLDITGVGNHYHKNLILSNNILCALFFSFSNYSPLRTKFSSLNKIADLTIELNIFEILEVF